MPNSYTPGAATPIGGTSTGLQVWAPSTTYAVGARTISPSGRPIVCRVAHISTSTYDATNWLYPGPRNEAIVDFTILPNGPITSAEPTVGGISSFGLSTTADGARYQILNGRATVPPGVTVDGVCYFALTLPATNAKVKHVWAVYDVPSTLNPPASLFGCTIGVPSDEWNSVTSEKMAGIHWQLYSSLGTTGPNGQPGAAWNVGPYNTLSNISLTGTIAGRSQTGVTRTTATLSNPFTTTNGSATVAVAATGHGAIIGDWVTFSGVTNPFGGLDLNGTFQISAVAGVNTYNIQANAAATSSAASGGGASVSATYQTSGLVNDILVVTGTPVAGTQSGVPSTKIIRPGMQISGVLNTNGNSSGTSITVPFDAFITKGMFITGANVPTAGTTVVSVTTSGTNIVIVASNSVTTTTGGQFIFSPLSGGVFQSIPNSNINTDNGPLAPVSPLIITEQLSGTPGQAGTYRLNMPNITTTATVGAVVPTNGSQPGLPIPIFGRTIRIDIIIDPNSGQQFGYLNGVLMVATKNGSAAAFTSNYAWIENPANESRLLEFGASAVLPEFYTTGANRVSFANTNNNLTFTNPITSTGTWLILTKFIVFYGPTGAVEVSFSPYIECIAGDIQMMVASSGLAPYTFFPRIIATATTKNTVYFSQVRLGTPGTSEEVAIWVRTYGAGNRVNSAAAGLSGEAGGWGSLMVRQVSSSINYI